jgi:uncharacterized protein with HEPN domain
MNENDLTRLRHMRDFAREVVGFVHGEERASLDSSLVLLRALCMSIGIIGEAASKVSNETREAYPQIRWSDILRTRNFLFHAYHRIDLAIVWATATVAVPELLAQLDDILSVYNDVGDS